MSFNLSQKYQQSAFVVFVKLCLFLINIWLTTLKYGMMFWKLACTSEIWSIITQVPEGWYVRMTVEELHLADNNLDRCYHWLEIQYNLPGQTGIK